MSKPHENEQNPHKPMASKEMSRRQFLTYTLGGATAFMVGGAALPMIRFAADPILTKKSEGNFVKVVEVNNLTDSPQEFHFDVHQVDGWYESTPKFTAWILKDDTGVLALSPICKHLGCTVGWNNNPALKEQYYCQCHGAHYTKDGKQLAIARAPLDEYKVRIENGFVYLGDKIPNTRVN